MTKREIKERMISSILANLESAIEEIDIDELIDAEMIENFMWEKDHGDELVEEIINENTEQLIQQRLEEIYEEIDAEDIAHLI